MVKHVHIFTKISYHIIILTKINNNNCESINAIINFGRILLMKKSIVLKYGLILLLLLSFISCSVLKKKKNCDCPEWSYGKTEKLKELT